MLLGSSKNVVGCVPDLPKVTFGGSDTHMETFLKDLSSIGYD